MQLDIIKSHVVYKINCPVEDCELPKPYYIDQTQNYRQV